MKKIGILFGQENTFPQAFVDKVNSSKVRSIQAEFVHVDEVVQARPIDYAVIIDRISQDVPFYRTFLKNAAATGTAVINNPFWWSADDKFLNNVLAEKMNVSVPKTVLLPSKDMPNNTDPNSFRNLKYPLDWEKMVSYLGGYPLYMKPYSGGGWKNVYKIHDYDELFSAYTESGKLVMMLQENIDFTSYFRCYCIGRKYVRIMPYEPRNPHHERYILKKNSYDAALLKKIEKMVIQLNEGLGYDFNTVEFAVREGIPYAIDFCNPAPDADVHSVGEDNFEWVVEKAAAYAIECAKTVKKGKMNLTWGSFVRNSVLSA